MSVSNLQKEVSTSEKANHKLQIMWTDTQKELLKIKQQLLESQNEKTILSSKIGINDLVKGKTIQQLEESKKEEIEGKFENTKLIKEIRRLQPLVDDLRQKNEKIEAQLTEKRLVMEESHINDRVSRIINPLDKIIYAKN
jgi:hypothetical protein